MNGMSDVPAEKAKAEVRSVAERYTAAITAGDEAAAASFTYRKEDGGLLWVSSVGRPITVLDVALGGEVARVRIQVEGMPPSPLLLRRIDDTWCVWP
jgi:hypothetical protein